ncbi:MAG: sensor histidine kinase N-terminal domain-containing protein [Fluviibacter sp.]
MKSRTKTKHRPNQRSLFGEILDWMLAPLLFVWPLSIVVTYHYAMSVAANPFDQNLRESALAISRQVHFNEGPLPVVKFSRSAHALLRADETDVVYYHVISSDGKLIQGDRELPIPIPMQRPTTPENEVGYRDTELGGENLRIAYTVVTAPDNPQDWVVVEVGESLEKRNQLINQIVASVILPQFFIVPVVVVLVWFGLAQGLRPLQFLQARIASRRENDLSPMTVRRMPEEIQPLVEAFNDLLDRMRDNLEVQQRFIADAAHQLKTPLTALKTQSQLAMYEDEPVALRGALQRIGSSVDRASHLVSQLLTLARAESSGGEMQAEEKVDLVAQVRAVAEEWVLPAAQKHLELDFEAPAGGVPVFGNAFLLREMVSNLIDNAIRYTSGSEAAPGKIHVRVMDVLEATRATEPDAETPLLQPSTRWAVLEVEDNGVGLSALQAELVFERFYRVDDAKTSGSGLGLPIVREIASYHHGEAHLIPNAGGKGVTARVRLPLYVVAPPAPELPYRPPLMPGSV